MALESDAKFEEELTCQFKTAMRNLMNFDLTTQNPKNFPFNKLSLTKVQHSTETVCLMALKIDAKFEGKLTCAYKNDMKNLSNFHQSTRKSQNWAVCSCHVTYTFQSESTLYSCLNVKELLARNRREI